MHVCVWCPVWCGVLKRGVQVWRSGGGVCMCARACVHARFTGIETKVVPYLITFKCVTGDFRTIVCSRLQQRETIVSVF